MIFTDQTKSGSRSNNMARHRILMTVVIKLIEPKIEEIPAKCSEKMARSTEAPPCARLPAKGG